MPDGPGNSSPVTGAPPSGCRTRRSSSLCVTACALPAGLAAEAPKSDAPSDAASFQGSAGRGGVPYASVSQQPASASAPTSVPAGSLAEHPEAANAAKPPAADDMASDMAARQSKMFVTGAPGPVASGMEPLAVTASNGLVKAAFDTVKVVCDQRARIAHACRVVGSLKSRVWWRQMWWCS